MREALLVGLVVAAATFGLVAVAGDNESTERAPAGSPKGLEVFARASCGNCHRLAAANSRGEMGPNLDAALPSHTAASLRAKILDPYPGGSGGFGGMPEDFGERLTAPELDALVAFLLEAGRR